MHKTIIASAAMAVLAVLPLTTAAAEDFNKTGPRGGTANGTVNCASGTYRAGCAGSWTYTNPAGASWSGHTAAATGPYRAGKVGVVTGPNGNAVVTRRVRSR